MNVIQCDVCEKLIREGDPYYELTLVDPYPRLTDNTGTKHLCSKACLAAKAGSQ